MRIPDFNFLDTAHQKRYDMFDKRFPGFRGTAGQRPGENARRVAVNTEGKKPGRISQDIFRAFSFEKRGDGMSWVYLTIAGLFEVVWSVALKFSEGFSRLAPSIVTIGGMIISFYFLSLATKTLPLGTAYAIWTGIGAVGAVILGIVLFQEPVSLLRMLFLAFILIGILGLKYTSQ